MTKDEAITELSKELTRHEEFSGRGMILSNAIRFAISILETVEDETDWTDEPKCPRCGGPTRIYADGDADFDVYCAGDCKDLLIETRAKFQTKEYEGD